MAPFEASPALVDELDEGQAGVLLDGVLPLLNIEDKKKLPINTHTNDITFPFSVRMMPLCSSLPSKSF